MKRPLSVILLLLLTIMSFTSCLEKPETIELENQVSQELTQEYNQLLDFTQNASELKEVEKYILDWADANSFKAYHDKNGNISISKDAYGDYENEPSTIVQCTLTLENPEIYVKSMATALYILKNAESHGRISVLFTSNEDGAMNGAYKINDKYLKADRLISLDWIEEKSILTESAGITDFTLSKSITWSEPICTNAYEISIQGLSETGFLSEQSAKTNPIKVIGDLLAGVKSSGILFELASFNGGLSGDTQPTAATAVVLLNDNDINKFTKRFNSSRDKLIDKYSKNHVNLTYTLTEIELPDKVVSAEDCTSIVSLLYTLFNGVYLKSDGGVALTVSNLGSISTYTGNFIANVSARSVSEEALSELSTTFETICGLCNVRFFAQETAPIWSSVQNSALAGEIYALMESIFVSNVKIRSTLLQTECSVFQIRNPELAIVSIGISEDDMFPTASLLLEFLDGSKRSMPV